MRRTPLKRVSEKRRAQMYNRDRCKTIVRLRSKGQCELGIAGVCTGKAKDAHELLPRAQGGDPTDPANVRDVCRRCHDYAHANPEEAYAFGWLIRGHQAEEFDETR
ncbi:MAG: hypothetical protein AAF916_04250 [Planctomycetota bacterium]